MNNKHHKGNKKHSRKTPLVMLKAKVAYETYAMTALKNAAYGNTYPVWEDLSKQQRVAWHTVVNVVRGLK